MRALYIGKFQPFHKGHSKAVELVKSFSKELVICLGSPQNREFFSLEERIEMIRKNTCLEPKVVDDLQESHQLYWDWGRYILDLIGSVDLVVTGNESVKEDFTKHNIPILLLPRYEGISGADIRRKIANRDGTWKELVEGASREIIMRSDFYNRYSGGNKPDGR